MFDSLRDLLDRHAALLRAELGAIARDVFALFLGGAVVASLLVGAVVVTLGALIVGLASALYGSPLFGIATLVAVLLSLAAWIPVVLLHADRGRRERRRAVLPALGAVLLIPPLGLAAGLAPEGVAGVATIGGIVTFAVSLLLSLRELDRAALADRFYPHISAAELRRTIDAADALRRGRTQREDDDE